MAVVACSECGGKVATTAEACPHCGAARAKPRPFATKEDFVGGLLIIAGLGGLTHYGVFFQTTVETSLGELHNVGLLQDRQNGLIVSAIVFALGVIVGYVGRRR